jgi:hypothetical protein
MRERATPALQIRENTIAPFAVNGLERGAELLCIIHQAYFTPTG